MLLATLVSKFWTSLTNLGVCTTLAAPVDLLFPRTMSTHISSFSQYFESPNSYSNSNSRNLPAIIDIVHFLIWAEKLIRWGLCKNCCLENLLIINKIFLYWVTKFQKISYSRYKILLLTKYTKYYFWQYGKWSQCGLEKFVINWQW